MKKILLALLIAITVSVSAFSSTSNDIPQSVYLRHDVFEAKMDAFMTEIRLLNEQLRSELHKELQATKDELHKEIQANSKAIQQLHSDIQITNTRLDDLYTMVYWGLALMGIILAFSAAVPYLVKLFDNIFQPRFTLEDVEKLIDAKLQRNNS